MPNAQYTFDRTFQLDILKLYVQDPNLLSIQNEAIKPSYFSTIDLQYVCRGILTLFHKFRKKPTSSELKAFVLDGVGNAEKPVYSELIESIYNDSPVSNRKFVQERMLTFGGKVELARACQDIQKLLQDGDDLEKARDIIDRALQVGYIHEEGIDILDEIGWDKFSVRVKNSAIRTKKIPTMLPTFNSFSGGLGHREVGVIIGGSGVGKSTILANLGAYAVISCVPTWLISLENEYDDLCCQFASRFTGMTTQEILEDRESYESMIGSMIQRPDLLRADYFNPGDLDVEKMRMSLNHYHTAYGFKPELIIIDYADRMKGEKEYEQLGDLYDELSGLAHDYNAGIWTASQTNRHGWKDETVTLDRVANSSLKIANVDVAWTISQTSSEKGRGLLRIFVGKTRRSMNNYVLRCEVDYARCLVTECAKSYISGDSIEPRDENKYNKK